MSSPSDPIADLQRQRDITSYAADLFRSGQSVNEVMSALMSQFPGTPLHELTALAGTGQDIAGPQAPGLSAPLGDMPLQPGPLETVGAGYRWAEQDVRVTKQDGTVEVKTIRVKVNQGDSWAMIVDAIGGVVSVFISSYGEDEVDASDEIMLIE